MGEQTSTMVRLDVVRRAFRLDVDHHPCCIRIWQIQDQDVVVSHQCRRKVRGA